MPWTIKDVDEFNKGLTDKQKEVWVKVANESLMRCKDKDGSECDASAIKQANSVVGNMKNMESSETYSISNMEIFLPGTHNKEKYTNEDLKNIENNFNLLKDKVRPKLKITHFEDQISLAGLASYGEFKNIYTKEDNGILKLYADLEKVPATIIDWIKQGTFAERSIELWDKLDVEGKQYNNVLTAVALLGHELPAVPGMKPVFKSINFKVEMPEGIKTIKFLMDKNIDTNKKMEEIKMESNLLSKEIIEEKVSEKEKQFSLEIETLKKSLNEAELVRKDFETTKQELEVKNKELEMATSKIKEFEAKNIEIECQKKELEIKSFCEEHKEKIIPCIKDEFIELYKNLDNSKKVTFSVEKNGKKETTEKSLLEIVKSIFSKLPKFIDTKEISQTTNNEQEGILDNSLKMYKRGEETFNVSNADLDVKAKEYMKKEKVSYIQALEKVSKK